MKNILVLMIILTSSVVAQVEGNPENWCRNCAFPGDSETFGLGKIKAVKGERVYFYGDDDNCPTGKNCRQKAYLLNGDEVIISRKFGNWACSWYQPKKGSETVGWISLDKLQFIDMVQGIESYSGKWKYYDNEIEINKTKEPKVFGINGIALWKGMGDNVHTGELDGNAVWNERFLAYGEDETDQYACKVKLNLVGSYLIVSDNLNCGGLNVTFSGVYRRKSTR